MHRFQTSLGTTVRNCFGLIALTLSLAAAVPACATTWKVTSSADDATPHTLRSALANANNGDTILISGDLKAPIVLTQGDIVVSHSVTVTTATARTPTISGNNNSRLFEISGASVTLNNLNFTNGNGVSSNPNGDASWDTYGGAVLVDVGGALNVSNCSFTQNQCSQGGAAIELVGNSLTVRKSTFVGGDAFYGTAIDDENTSGTDTMSLTDCEFANNTTGGGNAYGGVLTPTFGSYTVTNCHFRDNSAGEGSEGVIATYFSTMTITGCTLVGNSTAGIGGFQPGSGGAISNTERLTITGCILSGNSAIEGGAIYNEGLNGSVDMMTLTGCILFNNTAAYGGGIFNTGTATVTWCTLYHNAATSDGGGIYNGPPWPGTGPLSIGTSVFSGNTPNAIAGPAVYTDLGGNTFH